MRAYAGSRSCKRKRGTGGADGSLAAIHSAENMSQHSPALCFLPASTQRALFRDATLSPVDVLQAQIAQIENHGAALNALTYDHFESAFDTARAAEARYRAGTARPLEGVTVAVKDEY